MSRSPGRRPSDFGVLPSARARRAEKALTEILDHGHPLWKPWALDLADDVIALERAVADKAHLTHRMLQSLDAYWLHCDGLPANRYPRGRLDMEDWWTRFERYRAALNRYCDECLGPCRDES